MHSTWCISSTPCISYYFRFLLLIIKFEPDILNIIAYKIFSILRFKNPNILFYNSIAKVWVKQTKPINIQKLLYERPYHL